MKRVTILLLVVFLAAGAAAYADTAKKIKQGNVMIGGGADLGAIVGSRTFEPDIDGAESSETSRAAFGLEGLLGFFVIDGLELGPFWGVDYEKFDNEDADFTQTAVTWAAGGQLGYFLDWGTIAVPYILVKAGYISGNYSTEIGADETTDDSTGFLVGPRLGANVFVTRSVALDLAAFYEYAAGSGTQESGDEMDYDTVQAEYGFLVGFNIFF
jgi:hypothetical protein